MALEVTNSLRGPSVIRCVEPGTYTINLSDLRKNTAIETVTTADIKRVTWSTNGSITIVRNITPVLSLQGSGEMRFDEFGHSIANNNTSNVVVTIATGGTLVMELSKQATFSVDVNTGV
jgi:hypothetical protein